ncbi:MAG: hypothetical protein H7Y32_03035, partial [Chloroflexales bacterium]|nr:hypothetical protein [Chloroflexales bacterium]
LYEMVTGQRPYLGDTPYTVILKQATEPIRPPRTIKPDLLPAVEALLLKALSKDRQDRFQTATEFRGALQQIARAISGTRAFTGEPAAAHQSTAQQARTLAGRARSPWRLLTVAVGGAALVAAVSLGRWWPADLDAPAGETASAPTANVGAAQAFPSPVSGASTAPAASAGEATSKQTPLGRVQFDPSARAGDVLLDVDLIGAPSAGYHYALWLVGEGVPPRNLGSLPVERNRIHFVAQGEQNLLVQLVQAREVLITLEANGSSGAAPGQTVLAGAIAQELRVYTQQLLLNDALNQRGLLPGLEEQAELALEHAGFLRQAVAADNLAEARRHAEHVVNILDGAGGEHFGDLNGDGEAQNPGDGVGIRRYLAEARTRTRDAQASLAPDSTSRRYLLLAESAYTSNAVLVAASVEHAQKVLAADSSAEAQPFAADLAVQLVTLLQGGDNDRNRVIDPFAGEGGIAVSFDYVRLLSEIQLFP